MIKLNLIRGRNTTLPLFLSKVERNLATQIMSGIKSSPLNETQFLQVQISDKPFSRFVSKFLELPADIVHPKMKAVFTRAIYDGQKLSAKKYHYTDVFSAVQIDMLKDGKNLAKHEGSFVHKLIENINKSITE